MILGIKLALPRLLGRGSGHVVNMASAAGAHASLPGEATYVATKHAVVGLSRGRALRARGHRRRLLVRAAQPGAHPPRPG